MSKKPKEPDEMRMPADQFDEKMRRALQAEPPAEINIKTKVKAGQQKREDAIKSI